MKEENFCKILIYSILNFICFLLSIIFFTSVYNIKYQDYDINNIFYCYLLEKHYKCSQEDFNNQYRPILAMFILYLMSFLLFIFVLLIIMKRNKKNEMNIFDKTSDNEEENNQNNNGNEHNILSVNINNNNNNNILTSERRLDNNGENNNNMNRNILSLNNNNNQNTIHSNYIDSDNRNNLEDNNNISNNANNINNNMNNNTNEDVNEEKIKDFKVLMNILFYTFLLCQILNFIELIILSSFHAKSRKISKDEEKECQETIRDCITKTYTYLLIVGYIFLFILSIFYIYLLILKFGNTSKKRLSKMTNSEYCECCGDCVEKACVVLTSCFKTQTDEEREQENNETARSLKEEITQKEKLINELEDYKHNLKELNNKYSIGNVTELELGKLNLFKILN